MDISQEEIRSNLDKDIFRLISQTADEMHVECYLIGGYVRDFFLYRPSNDLDIVTVGKGIELAKSFAEKLGRNTKINVFKTFGTAQIKYKNYDIEFVGARKESYSHDSRNPVVKMVHLKMIRKDVISP